MHHFPWENLKIPHLQATPFDSSSLSIAHHQLHFFLATLKLTTASSWLKTIMARAALTLQL